MSKKILVSVVIPGYKNKFICETIDSVLNQTVPNIEIIVVDDGSPNHLEETLSSYIEKGQIRYIYQKNQKMAAARNNGINNAVGEFVAFLDDDDIWLPNKLEKQLACFQDESVGLVYTFAEGFDGSTEIEVPAFEKAHTGKIFKDIFLNDFIANSSVIVRKSCFDEIGLFKSTPDYFGVDDCDMWTRITYHYDAKVIKEKLTKIRIHDEQFSGDRTVMLNNDLNARKQLIKELDVPIYYRRKYFQRIYFDIGYGLRKKAKIKAAGYYLLSFFSIPSTRSFLGLLKLFFN